MGGGCMNAPAKFSTPPPVRFISSAPMESIKHPGPGFWPQVLIFRNENAKHPAFYSLLTLKCTVSLVFFYRKRRTTRFMSAYVQRM